MNLNTPIKLKLLGKELEVHPQKALGVSLLLIVAGTQLVNRGGVAQIPLPDAVDAALKADLNAVADEAKEIAVKETQFNGTLPENVDIEAIKGDANTAINAANGLSTGGQLLILALVNERKDQFMVAYDQQRNNPENKECYAVRWTDGECLASMLKNRNIAWKEAKNTPSTDDDMVVAFEGIAFALATQQILGTSLDVETPLVDYYDQQLKAGSLKVNRETAYAQLSNLMGLLGTSLIDLQDSNNGTLAAIANKSKGECLGGVINAEQLKLCGGSDDTTTED